MDFLIINLNWIALLPEFYLIFCINLILFYSINFAMSPSFNYPIIINNVTYLSIQSLFFMFFLIFNNHYINFLIFNNLFIIDLFGNFIKLILILSTILIFFISLNYNKIENIKSFEFSILILLVLLGLSLLLSSYNLFLAYITIELQSFASYILAALKRNSEFAAESGLKYFILSSFSSGFLLFGCSLIYGFLGTLDYSQMSVLFIDFNLNLFYKIGFLIGMFFVLISIFFKLSVAPFHLWISDIYEGCPSIVTAFFAIVPKIGLFVFLIRLYFGSFYFFYNFWQDFIFFGSFLSLLIGCFGALFQTKLKRLFAFSTINHIGFMSIILLCNSFESFNILFFYIFYYILMSVGCFLLLFITRKNYNT